MASKRLSLYAFLRGERPLSPVGGAHRLMLLDYCVLVNRQSKSTRPPGFAGTNGNKGLLCHLRGELLGGRYPLHARMLDLQPLPRLSQAHWRRQALLPLPSHQVPCRGVQVRRIQGSSAHRPTTHGTHVHAVEMGILGSCSILNGRGPYICERGRAPSRAGRGQNPPELVTYGDARARWVLSNRNFSHCHTRS